MSHSQTQNKNKWFWLIVLFSVLGMVTAAYLTYVHIQVNGPGNNFSSFCNISAEVNCDEVALSPWSMMLGIPVSVWGFSAYLIFLLLSLWRLFSKKKNQLPIYILWLAVISVGLTICLALISKLLIQVWCILCVTSWIINLLILCFAILGCHIEIKKHVSIFWQDILWVFKRPIRIIAMLIFVIALGTLLVFSTHQEKELQAARLKRQPQFKELDHPLPLTGMGFGSETPAITLIVFSDFQCPHCKHLHEDLLSLVHDMPQVRVIHKNYPLDMACNPIIKKPFHTAACQAASFALCAGKQVDYWKALDQVMENQKYLSTKQIFSEMEMELNLNAKEMGSCMESNETKQKLSSDIQEGMALGLKGTPVIIFNGTHQLLSNWSQGQLSKIVKEMLQHMKN